jgi:copper transport protein
VAAHASLHSSDPVQGSRLDVVPERVQVTLTEPVDRVGTSLRVFDASNRQVDLGDLRIEGTDKPTLSVALPRDLPHGAYRMEWRALSTLDGHPSSGIVGFAVGAFAAPLAPTGSEIPTSQAFARALAYAGFSLAFAAAAFLLWMTPLGYPAWVARVALLAGATLHAAGAFLLLANVSSQAGIPLGEMGSSEVGRILLLRAGLGAAAWLLALVWTLRPVAMGPAVVTALLLGAGLASARLGHPYLSGAAMMGLDFIHLVAASVWAGGLLLLLHHLRRVKDFEQAQRLGIRFGTLALVSVGLLVATGLILSAAVLGPQLLDPVHILEVPYGGFLAGKVGLAFLMIGLAAVNRYAILAPPTTKGLAGKLQGWLGTDEREAPGRLKRIVAVEAAVGVVVLMLAGFLTSVPPPVQAQGELVLEAVGNDHHVLAELRPPRVGETSAMHFTITPLSGGPAVANNTCGRPTSCVTLELTYEGLPPESHDTFPVVGKWMVHDVVWLKKGPVRAVVVASTAEVFEDRIEFTFQVR